MKKVSIALGILGTLSVGVYAQQGGRPLLRLANEVASLVRNNAYTLDQEQRRQVRRNLRQAKRILLGEYVPAPNPYPPGPNPYPPGPNPYPPGPNPYSGYYCVAACKNYSGGADFTYSKGASGDFEVQAKQNAVDAVNKAFSCNYGVKNVSCEQVQGYSRYSAIASCKNYSGGNDLSYAKTGSGSTKLEAQQNARNEVKKAYNCNYGIKIYETSNGVQSPAYCVAACKNYSGGADLNYSKGASGEDLVDAKGKAIEAVNKAYTCNYGVKINECSN